jgi:PAS domain S-box-containing protein
MEQLLEFGVFTAVPAFALILGIVYSLREIYLIGEHRFYIIVLILGFMLFHQINEMATFIATGEFGLPLFAETLESSANLIAAGSVYYVLAFTRDERELKEELAESRAEIEAIKDRLELIFDNVNDGILLVDLDRDEIIEANKPAHDLLRYEDGELEGLSPYDIHPHEPEQFRELQNALQPDGGVISESMSCRRKDGSIMPAAVSASRTNIDDSDLFLVTIRDNTAREQYRTQVDLLGRVLRHNLRNDMSVVIGNLDILEKSVDDEEMAKIAGWALEKSQELVEMSDKTRKLNEILDTERKQIGQVADLVTLVERVVEDHYQTYPAARIETDLPDSAPVQASNDVVWAIENVVENAIVHAETEPHLRVSVRNDTVEDERGTSEWTILTVADDGPGIPEDEVTVLRDDTSRTSTAHGSGLGLWVVKQIAEAFDGKLVIDREPASGFTTAVSLRLQPGANGYAIDENQTEAG